MFHSENKLFFVMTSICDFIWLQGVHNAYSRSRGLALRKYGRWFRQMSRKADDDIVPKPCLILSSLYFMKITFHGSVTMRTLSFSSRPGTLRTSLDRIPSGQFWIRYSSKWSILSSLSTTVRLRLGKNSEFLNRLKFLDVIPLVTVSTTWFGESTDSRSSTAAHDSSTFVFKPILINWFWKRSSDFGHEHDSDRSKFIRRSMLRWNASTPFWASKDWLARCSLALSVLTVSYSDDRFEAR